MKFTFIEYKFRDSVNPKIGLVTCQLIFQLTDVIDIFLDNVN